MRLTGKPEIFKLYSFCKAVSRIVVDMEFLHNVGTRKCKTPCRISNISSEERPLG